MYSEVDEGKGLVKCYWKDVREQVAKVEPRFAALIDEIDPGEKFPVFKAYYPYGMTIADKETFFICDNNGNKHAANSTSFPSELNQHIGYGADSIPFGMLLNKTIENYISRDEEKLSIPWRLSSPGDFFPLARALSRKSRIYMPNGIMNLSSGARSVFMLPNIGSATQHSNLQRDLNVKSPPPKSLGEHWEIFKEINTNSQKNSPWTSCLLFFSENWLKKIHDSKVWQDVKTYLYEDAWYKSEFHRNKVFYDIIFSVIQKDRNLKPNPYLVDTARHLYTTALGDAPGYIPATDNKSFPLELIQEAYITSYGLKKYLPNIMQPSYYIFEDEEKHPIYYSLQNPSTYIFSPKSRQISSTLDDLREIEHIVNISNQELKKDSGIAYNTIMNKIAKKMIFRYFHNKTDRYNVIEQSENIPILDPRFDQINKKIKLKDAKFASDAPFVRGCVSMGYNFSEH